MSSAVGQPPRVLIVEDDDATRRSLERLFLLNGSVVETAASVGAALTKLAWEPHWIILDLHLKWDDGETVLRTVRDKGLPIKVAVVTGSADRARLAALRQLRPECILVKPIQFSALLECVNPSQQPPSKIA
ncbi:MAG TPA: response regulator [Tepidisphaeraceae bacterium]|jgi:two-component system response regulator PrrA